MKRLGKYFLIISIIVFSLVILSSTQVLINANDFALDTNVSAGEISADARNFIGNLWAVIQLILQVLVTAAFIYTGVQYMFAPADKRGEIKSKLIFFVIGVILAFASPTVINFITESLEGIFNG